MQAVILAAGESSRFWPFNQKHKSLFKLMGKPLIYYLIEGLKNSGIKEIIVVQSPKRDVEAEMENHSSKVSIQYVIQKKPLGTGDAILEAAPLIKNQFLLLNAERIDCPDILEKIKKEKSKAILFSAPTQTPWLFGNLKIKGNKLLDIVEKPKKGKEFSNFKNVGIYFLPKNFLNYLAKIPPHPHSLIQAFSQYAKKEELKVVKIKKEPLFLKYPWDLFNISEYLFKKIKREIKGKTESNCSYKGLVFVGEKTVIKSGTYIEGPVYIGKNCQIGPNCYIRPFSSIGDNCFIGSGTEVKNSIISDNSKITHLSYVGDSIIGENCNLGAGTILANLRFDKAIIKSMVKGKWVETGRQKFGCAMGSNTQIGINCSIMPGVLIGSNCLIGPNVLVKESIKDNQVFYIKYQKFVKNKKN